MLLHFAPTAVWGFHVGFLFRSTLSIIIIIIIAAVIQGSTGDFCFDKLALTRGNDFLKHSDNVYSKVSQKSELWENYLTELNNF